MKSLITFFKKRQNYILFILLLLLFVVTSETLFARAGGAGGSSGSGGDGGGIIEIVIHLIMLLPFPYNIIAVGVIILLYYLAKKKAKQQTVLNKLPSGATRNNPKGYSKFLSKNPDFNESQFKEKARIAFMSVQKAWEAQDISNVRKFISDGVYQRFNTQFKMMSLLDQKNTIDNLQIKNIYIDKAESDGLFDILHVAIHASIKDKFLSKKYPQFNSGGTEEFVEYWSFIKKRGTETKDIYNTTNCPNCGGELPPNAGEVSKCPYCNTITNLGDYDWILSEITQADDYISTNPKVSKSWNLYDKVRDLFSSDQDFSIQLIEDKASNGYLQIQTAKVMRDPKLLRRFVSDSLYEKLEKEIPNEQVIFNRLYLNDVTLVAAEEKEDKHLLMVAVKSSFQRVMPKGNSLVKIDQVVVSKTEVVYLERDKTASKAQGSLYAHDCPSCGAPIGDTLDLKCKYCGAEVNSTKFEWIIKDIVDPYTHRSIIKERSSSMIGKVDTDKLDDLFDVRDYAFNNVLIMIAADGVFDTQEKEFAEKIAKKWGYSINKIQPMFDMAMNGQLVIRMPGNPKQKKKIFKLMLKAAQADNSVCKEEQQLLDNIKQQYNIEL